MECYFPSRRRQTSQVTSDHRWHRIHLARLNLWRLYTSISPRKGESGFKANLAVKVLGNHNQFSSVAQSCPTLCDPMDSACQASLSITNPGTYSNSCPLSWWCHLTISSSVVPFSSCPQSSQHQGLFKWVNSSHQVAKVLEFRLQHQSFQWIFRTDFL